MKFKDKSSLGLLKKGRFAPSQSIRFQNKLIIKVARTYLYACWLYMCVFQNERFNRFLWFLAYQINNDGTLRKCYLFSCRYKKNLWDIGIYWNHIFTNNVNSFEIPRQRQISLRALYFYITCHHIRTASLPCLYVLSLILSEILVLSLLLPIISTWRCPRKLLLLWTLYTNELNVF